jgi:MFS family permease
MAVLYLISALGSASAWNWSSLVTFLTNLAFTRIAMSVIDRFGRKRLLLTGAVGTSACLAGVAAIFAIGRRHDLLIWLLIAYIGFFAFSQGAVIWVYLSEVFPNRVRAKGQSLGSFTHWMAAAIIVQEFPRVANWSKPLPFIFFAAITVVQLFVVLTVYPETKGVSLEEIQKAFSVA